jgi:hypothetical protein
MSQILSINESYIFNKFGCGALYFLSYLQFLSLGKFPTEETGSIDSLDTTEARMDSTNRKILEFILFEIQIQDRISLILAQSLLASPGSSRQEGPGSRQERSVSLPRSFSAMDVGINFSS